MKSRTVSEMAAAISMVVCSMTAVTTASAQVTQSNPLQYVEIETGHKNINDLVNKQTKAQEKTGLLQATISGEFTKIKQWEGKYNSYLKTASGSVWDVDERIFQNRNVILIDDVITTGSTFREVCFVMKYFGAKRIVWLIFGRTIHPRLPFKKKDN